MKIKAIRLKPNVRAIPGSSAASRAARTALSKIYLNAAAAVAERNQYTCHMDMDGHAQISMYRDLLGPSDIDERVPVNRWWWSEDICDYPASSRDRRKYAHNARVIALLLASEAAKTGDIPTPNP